MSNNPFGSSGAGGPDDVVNQANEERIRKIVERCLEDLQHGLTIDVAAIEAQYADLAPTLGRRLRFIEKVARAAHSDSGEVEADAETSSQAGAGASVHSRSAEVVGSGGSGGDSSLETLALGPRPGRLVPAELSHRLNCPHCGNVVQLVSINVAEVTCRGCGSTFRLESGRTFVFGPSPNPHRIGPYDVRAVLGRGAFGLVYRAFDSKLTREVAIKIPRLGYFENEDEKQRFFREARAAARLTHHHIVRLYEVDQEGDTPYIVSQFVEGRTLDDWCSSQRLPFRETAKIVRQVAEALHYAHQQGVVHRDVKPSNILLDTNRVPFLTDFGLARRDEGEVTMTLDGEVLGTPAYMSPEQAEGRHQLVDGRSDVFSMGVVLYRLLTGELPFRGNRRMTIAQVIHDDPVAPRAINDHIPRDLETIALKAMAKQPSQRYVSAQALADDLERWLENRPILARPETRAEKWWRWCQRNPMLAGVSGALVVTLLVAAIGGVGWALHASALRRETEQALERETLAKELAHTEAVRALHHWIQAVMHQVRREWDVATSRAAVLTEAAWEGGGDQLQRDDAQRLRLGLLQAALAKPVQMSFADSTVNSTDFSADGHLQVVGLNNDTAVVWDAKSGERIATLTHGGPVFRAAISPQGDRVITGGSDDAARLWNVATGQVIGGAWVHTSTVRAIAFSPDGSLVATGCQDGSLRITSVATGQVTEARFEKQPDGILDLAFSPDGKRLASSIGANIGVPGGARLWDVATGAPIGPAMAHTLAVRAVAFSPDGKLLATAGEDRQVKVWNGETAAAIEIGNSLQLAAPARAIRFLADGRKLLVTCHDKSLRVWDVEQRKALTSDWRFDFTPSRLAISPDQRRVLVAGDGEFAEVRDIATGYRVAPQLPHSKEISGATFQSDGRHVVLTSIDGVVKVLDLTTDQQSWPQHQFGSPISHAWITDNERLVLVGGVNGQIARLDSTTLAPLGAPLEQDEEIISLMAQANSQVAAVLDKKQQVHLWDLTQGKTFATPATVANQVKQMQIHGPTKRLLTVSEGGIVQIHDLATGKLISSANVGRLTYFVRFSPAGQWFATGGAALDQNDGPRVWNALTGTPVTSPLPHQTIVQHLTFSSDGMTLATAGNDGTVRLWDLPGGDDAGLLRHHSSVWAVRFDPQGRRLATTSNDGTAMIWDVASREPICPPLKHPRHRFVRDALFHPSGKYLVTVAATSEYGEWLPDSPYRAEIRFWETATGDPLGPAIELPRSIINVQFTADGSRLLVAGQDGTLRMIPFTSDSGSSEEVRPAVELLAGYRYDKEADGLLALTPAELKQRFEQVRTQTPARLMPPATVLEAPK